VKVRGSQLSQAGAVRQRALIWIVSATVGLPLLLFFSMKVGHRSEGVTKDGGYFSGAIPGVGTVFLTLDIDGTKVVGSAAFCGGADSCALEGERNPSGKMHFLARGISRNYDETNGFFTGEITGKPASFRGRWTTNGGNPVAFELPRIATSVAVTRKSGLLIRQYGGTEKYEARFPVFTSPLPFHQDINHRLRKDANEAATEFTKDGIRHMIDGVRMPGLENEYEGFDGIFVVYFSDQLVSLRKSSWAYSGGAHGNGGSSGLNFVTYQGKARELQLADLFVPGGKWEKRLSDLCLADLKQQGASWTLNGTTTNFTFSDDSAFSVSPAGLIFYFAPYAVGSYAEGEFEVILPWPSLRGYFRSNSLPAWPGLTTNKVR
jgi:Protein of unknown function (DUF3298)